MKKLLLCSGPPNSALGNEGYFRVDADVRSEPDCVATIPPLPDIVKAQKWDEIALIHGIEHFYLWEAFELLKECREALAPGGELTLEQPNLEECAKYHDVFRYLMGIYGDPSTSNPAMTHHWGYTPHTLSNLLKKAGFADARLEEAQFHFPGRDFRMVATV